jgi:hypothetical protein
MPASRLVVSEKAYFQPYAEPAVDLSSEPFSRWLSTDEQPFQRKQKANEEWRPLELGWVETAGMVLLENERTRFQVQPSEAQATEAKEKIVEVKQGEAVFAIIRPGESCRFEPTDPKNLSLRCRSGECRVNVTILPN